MKKLFRVVALITICILAGFLSSKSTIPLTRTRVEKKLLGKQHNIIRNAEEFNRGKPNAMKQSNNKRLPNVFLIGAAKCGTGTLLSYLNLHPSIVSRQETTLYFMNNYDKDLEWYGEQMPPSKEGQIVIERGLPYMANDTVLDRLYVYNSSVKLLVILREPVDLTLSIYSEYLSLRTPRNKREFEDCVLMSGSGQVNASSLFIRQGRFSESLEKCYNRFPKNQILIIDGGTFVRDPYVELQKVETFLDIDQFYTRAMFVFDKEKGFYCPVLADGRLKCKGNKKGRKHITLPVSLRQKLERYYELWNQKLYNLTGMKLSWMK